MEILVSDIPEEGQTIRVHSQNDGWFRQILSDSLVNQYQDGDRGEADFFLLRTGKNVDCSGKVVFDYHPECCRCLKAFVAHSAVPIHRTLAPLYENERQLKLESEDEVAWVKEDLEFSFYEKDRFNLGDIIREELILSLPIQPICQTTCKGLCQRCGKDLNEGPCDCQETHQDPRWKPLKEIKTKLQRS